MDVSVVAAVILGSFAFLYLFFRYRYTYWSKRGFPGPIPVFPFGTLLYYGKRPLHQVEEEFMKTYGKLVGVYDAWKPTLMVSDTEIIKEVLVSKFSSFTDNFKFLGHKKLIPMMIMQSGNNWRRIRTMSSPAFTALKLKQMQPMMTTCVNDLVDVMNSKMSNKKATIDIKHHIKIFTFDVISRSAFATQVPDVYGKGQNEPFFVNVIDLLTPIGWKWLVGMFLPFSMKKILNFIPFPTERYEYTLQLMATIVDRKKKKLNADLGYPDFIDPFLVEGEHKMTDDEVIANAVSLMTAGFANTSNFIMMTIFVLSFEEAIQERLYQAVRSLYEKGGQKFDYDSLCSLEYLDAVINESLRYFPPVLRYDRVASEDVTLSNGMFIPKGMHMRFPVYHIHHNEEYWPDNMVYRPERWIGKNKDSIVPYSHIPFVVGPRICVGYRFALLEAKLALAILLINFKLSRPSNDTSNYRKVTGNAIMICPDNVLVDIQPR